MTQKEKEILIQDLCARLPYGVKIDMRGYVVPKTLCAIEFTDEKVLFRVKGLNETFDFDVENVKPYLRPLSDITESEKSLYALYVKNTEGFIYSLESCYEMRWCLKHHFDVNGLIQKGLAYDASKDESIRLW